MITSTTGAAILFVCQRGIYPVEKCNQTLCRTQKIYRFNSCLRLREKDWYQALLQRRTSYDAKRICIASKWLNTCSQYTSRYMWFPPVHQKYLLSDPMCRFPHSPGFVQLDPFCGCQVPPIKGCITLVTTYHPLFHILWESFRGRTASRCLPILIMLYTDLRLTKTKLYSLKRIVQGRVIITIAAKVWSSRCHRFQTINTAGARTEEESWPCLLQPPHVVWLPANRDPFGSKLL